MDPTNIVLIYSIENNVPVSKKALKFQDYFDWNSFDDLKACISKHVTKLKYFDEENDLISLFNQDDFTNFKELLLNKRFPNEEVFVIAYEGSIDIAKFSRIEKINQMKIENHYSSGFSNIKSVSIPSESVSMRQTADYESMSSSSSSSSNAHKKKSYTDKNKRKKRVNRYEAKLKKDVNYLRGSEVSDGQTIIKKWRIKNIGSKKWKENTVKSVLLPSEFSNWISCSQIKVPVCFADQKVDIEMEILINGQWDAIGSIVDQSNQDITLSWLIFIDSIMTKSNDDFKDYILAQLELRITVKKRTPGTEFQPSAVENELKKHLSESSIERIDHDFSIVNMSDEDQISSRKDTDSNCFGSSPDKNEHRQDSEDLEMELPECPHNDDLQISDFINPDSYISIGSEKACESDDKSLVNQSDPVGQVESVETTEDALKMKIDPLGEEVSFRNEEEVLLINGEEAGSAETMAVSRSDDQTYNSTHTQEIPISIDDNEDRHLIHVREIPLETNFTDASYSICDVDQMSPDTIDGSPSTEMKGSSDAGIDIPEHDGVVSNTGDCNECDADLGKCDHVDEAADPIVGDVINNQCPQLSNNPAVSRDIPADSIKNEFPRPDVDAEPTGQYIPGCPYPGISHQNPPYVAGIARNDVINVQHQSGNSNQHPPQGWQYQAPKGNIYPVITSPPVASPQIWPNNSTDVIENLRLSGNLPQHINDGNKLWKAENGQHYLTTTNMEKLKNMGFIDEQRNYRLLMKFNNNIHDVVNDLID